MAYEIPRTSLSYAAKISAREANPAIDAMKVLMVRAGWTLRTTPAMRARGVARFRGFPVHDSTTKTPKDVLTRPKREWLTASSVRVRVGGTTSKWMASFCFYNPNKEIPGTPAPGTKPVFWVAMAGNEEASGTNLMLAVASVFTDYEFTSPSRGYTAQSYDYTTGSSSSGWTSYITAKADGPQFNGMAFNGHMLTQGGWALRSAYYRDASNFMDAAIFLSYSGHMVVAIYPGGYTSGDYKNGSARGAWGGAWHADFRAHMANSTDGLSRIGAWHAFADQYQLILKSSSGGDASQTASPNNIGFQDTFWSVDSLLASVPWRPEDDPDTARILIVGSGGLKRSLTWGSAPVTVHPYGTTYYGKNSGMMALRFGTVAPIRTFSGAPVFTHGVVMASRGGLGTFPMLYGKLWNCAVGHDVAPQPASEVDNPRFRDLAGTQFHEISRQHVPYNSCKPLATLWYMGEMT